MLLVIVGESNGNHHDQRHNGKNHNTRAGQGQQSAVIVLVESAGKILPEGGDWLPALSAELKMIGSLDVVDPDNEKNKDHNQTDDAVKQNLKAVVIVVPDVGEQHRVKVHFRLYRAEGAEFCQIGGREGAAEPEQRLQSRDKYTVNIFSAADISCAHNQEGKFDEYIALDDCDGKITEKMGDTQEKVLDAGKKTAGKGSSHFSLLSSV